MKRPKLVWVILVWYLLSGIWTFVAVHLARESSLDLPPATAQMLSEHYAGWLWTVSMVVGVVLYAGCVLSLFQMKRFARWWFTLAFASSLLQTLLYIVLSPRFRHAMEDAPGSPYGMLFAILLQLAIVAYVFRLDGKGLLH